MNLIDAKLDQELSAFICGWDIFERKSGGEIIDMALTEKVVPRYYTDRHQILKDIENLLQINEIKNHDFIFKKMTAHKYFLLMSMNESIPCDEYFENTMGVKRVIFSDDKIGKLRVNAEDSAASLGLKLDSSFGKEFSDIEKDLMPKDVTVFLDQVHKSFYHKINNLLHLDADFNINYLYLPDDHQFLAWISGDGKDYAVRLHPKKIYDYPSSKLKILAAHELTAHAVHFSLLRRKVEQNLVPKYAGYVTVHEPLQFAAEGLANTISSVYIDEWDENKYIKIVETVGRLNDCALNNAHIYLSRGESIQDCMEYMLQNSALSKKEIASRLNYILTDKPLGLSYRQIYGIASETFVEITGNQAGKNKFTKSVYENFLLPEQIQSQVKHSIIDFV